MEIWGKVRAAACVAACAALLSGTAAAQETINFGSVSGRIADEQGAVVAGARVVARQFDHKLVRFAHFVAGQALADVGIQGSDGGWVGVVGSTGCDSPEPFAAAPG